MDALRTVFDNDNVAGVLLHSFDGTDAPEHKLLDIRMLQDNSPVMVLRASIWQVTEMPSTEPSFENINATISSLSFSTDLLNGLISSSRPS